MSLSSEELNYLVWRYLQETGHELAAYAFDKLAQSLAYEQRQSDAVLSKIDPGFLVSLVQKGILYSLAEADLRDGKRPEVLSFFGSLLAEEKAVQRASSIPVEELQAKSEKVPEPLQTHTSRWLEPTVEFGTSVVTKWHPQSNVVAYITGDSGLLISALADDKVAETASLNGPGLERVNDLSAVAWSPLGNLVSTASIVGDLCCWSPDGRLRNIVKSAVSREETEKPGVIVDIQWSPNGQYFLAGDTNGKISVWNGTNLQLLEVVSHAHRSAGEGWSYCWIGDSRFAASAKDHTIRVYSIAGGSVQVSGELSGHKGPASNMVFNHTNKRLASYSNADHSIKIWNKGSSALEEVTLHDDRILPLVALAWIDDTRLVSVSINGVVRVWSSDSESPVYSTNVLSPESLRFEDGSTVSAAKLVYAAELSPNGKYLAVGDDSSRVSIWDVSEQPFCQAVVRGSGSDTSSDVAGISYLSWNAQGLILSVSYKDSPSALIKWE